MSCEGQKKRYDEIDIAKGIGILLVILGHLDADGQLSRYMIYAFHMPLFFILSGVFADTKRPFKAYFIKNFKTLYWPFFVCFLFELLLIIGYGVVANAQFHAGIFRQFYDLIGIDFDVFNAPLWFLFVLFIIKIVFYFIRKSKCLKALFLCAGIAVIAVSKYVSLPANCLWIVALPCMTFFLVGDLFQKHILSLSQKVNAQPKKAALLLVYLLIVFVFGVIQNQKVNIREYLYGNGFLFAFNALAGTYIVLILSAFLKKSKFFSKFFTFFGENSLIVLVTHYCICRNLLRWVMSCLDLSAYLYSPTTQIVMMVVVVGIMIPTIKIGNRYLGFVFGKNMRQQKRSEIKTIAQ
ncbi:MAG: acyltransferase family protein [Clostridia bacterium]|nr:acyltransferase family protein [Clostridia bacterium]